MPNGAAKRGPEEPAAIGLLEAIQAVLDQVADPTVVLGAVLEQSVRATGATRGLFIEVTDGGGFEFRVLHGFQPGQLDGELGGFSRSLCARVASSGEPLLLENASMDPYWETSGSMQAIGTAAVLCMPIPTNGRIAAIVHLEKSQPGQFDGSHRDLMQSLAGVAGRTLAVLRSGQRLREAGERLRASEDRLHQEAEANRETLRDDWSFGRFVGRAPVVRDMERSLRQAAERAFPLLLTGETGTGKSILARAIHYSGPRARRPFITVSCPSLEKSMVEVELFGSRRGAFTGAVDREGKVQAAEGGTLFFDEIGDLPLEIQPKLFRLLEEKTYEVMGEARERRADIRIVSATNLDLREAIARGRFRAELFGRLNVTSIRVPPLRERVEDLPLLLRACLDREDGGRWIVLSPDAERYLVELPFLWPLNVRHLTRLAALLVIEAPEGPVTRATIERLLSSDEGMTGPPATAAGVTGATANAAADLPGAMAEAEREFLRQAIARHPDVTRADLARQLGIGPSTLYKKLREYGLE